MEKAHSLVLEAVVAAQEEMELAMVTTMATAAAMEMVVAALEVLVAPTSTVTRNLLRMI